MNARLVAPALAVLLLADGPSPSPAPTSPPGLPGLMNAAQSLLQQAAGDAAAPYGVDPNHLRGTVTFFQRFDLQIELPLRQYKNIRLHQGTVINPRGATIRDGDRVDVRGSANSDGSLNADEITIL